MVTVVIQLNAKNMTFAGYFSCRKRPFFSNVTIGLNVIRHSLLDLYVASFQNMKYSEIFSSYSNTVKYVKF